MSEIEVIKSLEKSGFKREQAEAQVQAVGQLMKDYATKADLNLVKVELKAEISLLRIEMQNLGKDIVLKLGGLMVGLFTIAGIIATWIFK